MEKLNYTAPVLSFLLAALLSACQWSDPKATDAIKDETNVLYLGQSLRAGDFSLILEQDGIKYSASLTEKGELNLYKSDTLTWKAETRNASLGYELIMQNDGNLVLYDWNFEGIWSSDTHPFFRGDKYRTADWKPVKLVLEPNLLVLYSATGRKVWNNEVGEIKSLN